MFPKPVVPLGPVIVNDKVVVNVDGLNTIVASDIFEPVTFLSCVRITISPFSLVAATVSTDDGGGDGIGEAKTVGLGVVSDVWVFVIGGVSVSIGSGFSN
jgi:hypothetical protein